MSLISLTAKKAATKSLFGNDATQVVYELNGVYTVPQNRAPITWYLGLFRAKSTTGTIDNTPVAVEGITRATVPNTDDFWTTDGGIAVNKKRIVFQGTLSGLDSSDTVGKIIMCALYDGDTPSAAMWMTGQLIGGSVSIKNGQGFAVDANQLVFSPDESVS
jgi:hypothetical protein